MRINIFTAIPLGVYLYQVERARHDGWDDANNFIQDLARRLYEAEVECGEKMTKAKNGSLEACRAAMMLSRLRGSDLGLDLILFTIDACHYWRRYMEYVKNYPDSKK